MAARSRRRFTDEFKKEIVQLYLHKKPREEIIQEYQLTPSCLTRWVQQYQNSGSFREKDNRRPEERELQELRKQNKQLLMENDILKQADRIMKQKKTPM
jgi:transposase